MNLTLFYKTSVDEQRCCCSRSGSVKLDQCLLYMIRMGEPIYLPPSIVTEKEMKKKREMMFTK